MGKTAKRIPCGTKFGKWTVLDGTRRGPNDVHCLCVCECGTFKLVRVQAIKHGVSVACQACGGSKHQMTGTPTHHIWLGMRERCRSVTSTSYRIYGGRGIKLCEQWDDFSVFLRDMGERPAGKSIERIDVNGDYEPGNCVWATYIEQNNNRRNNRMIIYDGVEYTMANLARHLNLTYETVRMRLKKGKPLEDKPRSRQIVVQLKEKTL